MIYFVGSQTFEHFRNCTLQQCLSFLEKQEVIGLDIETGRKYPKGLYPEKPYVPGLDPYVSRIVMLQMGTLKHQFVIDARQLTAGDWASLASVLSNNNIVKTGHNLKFECVHLLQHGLRLSNVWDTFICEKVLYNGLKMGYSLAALMQRYLGYSTVFGDTGLFDEEEEDEDAAYEQKQVDKSIRLQFIDIGDAPFTEEQIRYGVDDITAPLRIRNIQLKGRTILDENQQEILYLPEKGFAVQNYFTQVLGAIEHEGMEFDADMWREMAAVNAQTFNDRKDKLDAYVVQHYPQRYSKGTDIFSGKPVCAIQWTSSQQVIAFFRYLGICPKENSKSTRKMEWSVSSKAMLKQLPQSYRDKFHADQETDILTHDDLVLNYMLLKKAEKDCTIFGTDFLKYVHPVTGKIHSTFRQYMHTGRISSTNPNLQNIPSGTAYRECFRTKDHSWVNADYAAQESRILADVSANQTLMDFFNLGHEVFGDDLHSFAATNMERVIRKDPDIIVTKKSNPKARNIAKALNFALSYGGSAFSLKDTLNCSEKEAQGFIEAFFEGFPGLKDDFAKTKALAVKRGWVELDPFTGQKYFFAQHDKLSELKTLARSFYPPDYNTWPDADRHSFQEAINREHPGLFKDIKVLTGELERKALNYRIQGNAATMSKIAAILIHRQCLGHPHRAIVNLVHDEIIAKTSKDDTAFLEVVTSAMVEAGNYTCKKVRMGAEASMAGYWKH